MSERDDTRGGRYEPAVATYTRGEGLALVGRCDECYTPADARSRTKVQRGPLRGLRGMVCKRCMADRKAVSA